jgi:hypothetical protein
MTEPKTFQARRVVVRDLGLGLLLAGALGACGGGDDNATDIDAGPDIDGGGTGCDTPLSERLLPLVVGASWTFAVTPTGGGAAESKTSTVEALEDVGDLKAGVTAFRVRTEKLDGSTVSWQEDQCDGVVRHREQSFDLGDVLLSDQIYQPSKLRVDETAAHMTMGATWVDTYTEIEEDPVTGDVVTTEKSESWTVEAASESVTVPAGTFTAIKLRRTSDVVGGADKTYWFAPGVGKVKEVGDQTEELTEYTIP